MLAAIECWAARRHGLAPAVADLLLAVAVAALSLGLLLVPGGQVSAPASTLAIALTSLESLPLVARRRWPYAVLAVSAVAQTLYLSTSTLARAPIGLGLAVALYTVATRADRRTSFRIACLVVGIDAVTLFIGGLAFGLAGAGPALVALTAMVVGSWSLGENVRTRRAYLAQLEERAHRLEAEQEETARRAVQDERTRIACELHDVVAHHVSAIAVLAGAAQEIAERDPLRARETLQVIQDTSRQALAEMRAVINVLRSGDDMGAGREPQPSLAQIERLIAPRAADSSGRASDALELCVRKTS